MPNLKFKNKLTKNRRKGKVKTLRVQIKQASHNMPKSMGLDSLIKTKKFMRLPWVAGFSDDINTGAYNFTYFFRLNSPYDPDTLAQEPITKNKAVQGWTRLQMLYTRYKVYNMFAIIDIQNMTGSTPIRAIVAPTDSITTGYATSIKGSDLASRTGARSVIVGPLGSAGDHKTIKYRFDLRKIFGINKEDFGQDEYGAAVSTSPIAVQDLALSIATMNDQVASGPIVFQVSLRFWYGTLMTDPIENIDEVA